MTSQIAKRKDLVKLRKESSRRPNRPLASSIGFKDYWHRLRGGSSMHLYSEQSFASKPAVH